MKAPKIKKPDTIAPPPPPEEAPSELADAVDTNANTLKKKKKGAKGAFAANTGVNTNSSGSGLTINS